MITIIACFPLSYFFLSALLTKLTYFTEKGIRIGNSHNGAYTMIPIKRKAVFVPWNNVEYIELIKKVVRPGYVSFLKDFVVVKTKDRKRYECFIARPKSFLEALKKVKKDYLLKNKN